MYGERLNRWEKIVEWPLMAAAVVFLLAYSVQIIARLHGSSAAISEAVLWVTWGVFATDYIIRLSIAEQRGKWFVRHLLDLVIVVLPLLRPIRLMRLLAIIAIIQRGAGTRLRGRVAVYTIGATALTILLASLAVLDAEQGQGGRIQTFGDALWWAVVTITTVGYGDLTPVTPLGRGIAVALMIGGIALIGVVTATLASWIVQRVSDETQTIATATEAQVEDLRAEVAELKAMIRDLRPAA